MESSTSASPAAGGRPTHAEKVRRIFDRFDVNQDGGLNWEEMAALAVAVNPRVNFSPEQIAAMVDEVFSTYAAFVLPEGLGLGLTGLARTYEDGAGDASRDFDAIGLRLASEDVVGGSNCRSAPLSTGKSPPPLPEASVPWASSPNHGVVFASSWALVDELEIIVQRLRSKKLGTNSNVGFFFEPGRSPKNSSCDETSQEYLNFVKDATILRSRADQARSRAEAFDNHMAIGRGLYEHGFFRESLLSFRRSCELRPADVRAHFRIGNALYALGRHGEAKEEFFLALEAAEEAGGWSHSDGILTQVHVNLGIAKEAEGMIFGACEHYREASILCPTHFRALKFLGSALLGVGEFQAAKKALEEAIFLHQDFADAHCDLGSALHALQEDEVAVQEFEKAIELNPSHVDALYNLGGLFMDARQFARASEMYSRVLSLQPEHWRAQLNKAVALLGTGESKEARKAFNLAFKITQRVEVYYAIAHLKKLHKKKPEGDGFKGEEGAFMVIDPSKFKRESRKTTLREELANAMEIRAFQKATRLDCCNVEHLGKEMNDNNTISNSSSSGEHDKFVKKVSLEEVLRRLLRFIKPEVFQGSMRAINEKIFSVMDAAGFGGVDLGMFFAVIAPICSGHPDKRKRIAFDALVWRHNTGGSNIMMKDAIKYIKLLRAVFISDTISMTGVHGESDLSMISYSEFLQMLDDPDGGFGILNTFVKLEIGDRVLHAWHTCSICGYAIVGSRFEETKCGFSLCNRCYSEGRVPSAFNKEEYQFKEYISETEALKDKCFCFNSNSTCSNDP